MGDEREKTNPDYPVTPAWRPSSQPGVRMPAPPLEPAQPASQSGVAPLFAVPPAPRPQSSVGARPVSHSSYSLFSAGEESIRPLSSRPPSTGQMDLNPVSRPAFVAPTVVPVVPAHVPAPDAARRPSSVLAPGTQVPASRPTYRPASDGYQRPVSGTSAVGFRPASGLGMDVHPLGEQSAASQSRRAGDPTRLLPWLRDKNKWFSGLSDADAGSIFRFASLHRVEANTVLQAFDAAPTAAFALTSGTIVMRVRKHNGGMRELDRFGAGDVVGLLALVDGNPALYELVAASVVEVIAFEADQLAQFAAAFHPEALAAIRAWQPLVIDHLRTTQHRVARLGSARHGRAHSTIDDAWKGGT